MKVKRFIAGALCLVLLLCSYATIPAAKPKREYADRLQEQYQNSITLIEDELMEIERAGVSHSKGTIGALEDLSSVVKYSILLSALISATKYVNGKTESDCTTNGLESVGVLHNYLEKFADRVQGFYEHYADYAFELTSESEVGIAEMYLSKKFSGKQLDSLLSPKFNLNYKGGPAEGYKRITNAYQYINGSFLKEKGCLKDYQAITKKILTLLFAAFTDSNNNTDYNSLFKEYGVVVLSVYKTYSGVLEVCEEMSSVELDDTAVIIDALKRLQNISEKPMISGKEAYTSEFFQEILMYGIKLENYAASAGIDIDKSLKYIENLSDIKVNELTKTMTVSADPVLKNYYNAAVAASATYTPFVSYTGDEGFVSGFSHLINNDSTLDSALTIYHNTKGYKKPLYYRKLDSNGKPTGVATLITLKDFKEKIDKGDSGCLCALEGQFIKNDAGDWVYEQYGDRKVNADGSIDIPYDDMTAKNELSAMEKLLNSQEKVTKLLEDLKNGVTELPDKLQEQASDSLEDSISGLCTKTIDEPLKNAYRGFAYWGAMGWDSAKDLFNATGYSILNLTSFSTAEGKLQLAQDDDELPKALYFLKNTTETKTELQKHWFDEFKEYKDHKKLSSGWEKLSDDEKEKLYLTDEDAMLVMGLASLFSAYNTDAINGYKFIYDLAWGDIKSEDGHTWNFKTTYNIVNGSVTDFTAIYAFWGQLDGGENHLIALGGWAVDNDGFLLPNINAADILNMTPVAKADDDNFAYVYSLYASNRYTYNENDNTLVFDDGTGAAEEDNQTASINSDQITTSGFDGTLSEFIPTAYADVEDGFGESVESDNTEVGEVQESDDQSMIYAYSTVSNFSVISEPLLLFGSQYSRSTDNLTTMLLTNIFNSVDGMSMLDVWNTNYLYMDLYGNIVLSDDLVVLPAAANPNFYDNGYYNPFTAAFMNTYPVVLKNQTSFKLASKEDVGKYIVMSDYDPESGVSTDFIAVKLTSVESISPTNYLSLPKFEQSFSVNDGIDKIKVFKTRRLAFSDNSSGGLDPISVMKDKILSGDPDAKTEYATGDSVMYDDYAPLLNSVSVTINGKCAFPYDSKDADIEPVSKALADNMYTYLMGDITDMSITSSKLNDAYITMNLITNIIRGNVDAKGYENDILLEYDKYASNATTRTFVKLKDISSSLIENTGTTSGVIGIKSFYDNVIVATVLNFLKSNWIFFLIVVVMILLFFYNKTRIDLFQFVSFALGMLVCAYLYVTVLPDMIPGAFNLVTNNIADTLSYEILALEGEAYSTDSELTVPVNSDGTINYDSASINLYKFTEKDRDDLLNGYNITADKITGGNIQIINPDAGVYLKNNTLCVNTNILFDTLVFEGETEANGTYKIHPKKTVSNNVDYYVPYYQIVDKLVDKINDLADIYAIPKRTSTYVNGVIKSNYMLYCYVNSKPFISPGNYDYVGSMYENEYTLEELSAYARAADDVKNKLTDAFPKNTDWLGFADIIGSVPNDTALQATLWAQTLQELGYYDKEDWSLDKEMCNELISYVNYQTKKFVIEMSNQIGSLSDDVMIKVVAMRALIAFTQKASDFGHWMYPYSINYSDMSLKDVEKAVLISDYNKYVNSQLDTVNYVFDEHGWFTLIVFDLVTILLFVITTALNFLTPMFYLLLGLLIIYRLLNGDGIKDAIKGYLKASLVIFICSTLLTFSMLAARWMNGSAIAIYFLLFVMLLLGYIIISMFMSVVKDWTNFGNNKLNVSLKNRFNKFSMSGPKINRRSFHTHNLSFRRMNKGVKEKSQSRFGLNTGVEDFNDYNNLYDRRYHDDYYDDYYNGYDSDYDTDNLASEDHTDDGGIIETDSLESLNTVETDDLTELTSMSSDVEDLDSMLDNAVDTDTLDD